MTAKSKKPTPWRCPKCGREFARKSSYHGCGQYTVEGYLEGKNPSAVALFNLLVEKARGIGPFTLSPAKTQISFRVRSNFAMVFVAGRQIGGYLFLPRAMPAPFVRKITAASARRFVHHFRVTDPSQLDGQFIEMMSEAIALVSDAPAASPKSGRQPSGIGEEINAFFRSQRAQ